MSKQWHPLFAHLLGLLIEDYYKVETESPVSDLPRKGDLLIIRRQGVGSPPFVGLWSHLTDWNVLEFKGPTDDAEEDDLELLIHVGTGLTYRINEERRNTRQERLANRQVSFWYLAPRLGNTFLDHARIRTPLTYETGGLWRGQGWGHPVWLLSYLDTPVEEDTIPLRLLDLRSPAPRALGELVVSREELSRRFTEWLMALQPTLWKEIAPMTRTKTDIIDWEEVGKITDLSAVVKVLPTETVIQALGVERAIQAIGANRVIEAVGLPRVIEAVGLPRVIEAVGLPRVIEAIGPEKLMEELLARLPPEKVQEMLRRREQES